MQPRYDEINLCLNASFDFNDAAKSFVVGIRQKKNNLFANMFYSLDCEKAPTPRRFSIRKCEKANHRRENYV